MEKNKIMYTTEETKSITTNEDVRREQRTVKNEEKLTYFLYLFGLYPKISYEQFRELKKVAPNFKMKKFEKMKGTLNPLTLQYE